MTHIVVDGKVRVYWVTSISNIAAPTVAELNAGLSLTSQLTRDGLIGFKVGTNTVDVAGLDAEFDNRDVGTGSIEDPMLRLKKATLGADTIYSTLVYGLAGHVVIRPYIAQATAWTIAQVCRVYPVTCGYRQDMEHEPNTVFRYEIPTPVRSDPELDAVVA